MDVLNDLLKNLGLRSALYYRTDLSPPWGMRVPVQPGVARFHILLRGSAWVSVPGHTAPAAVGPGDVVLVPHGRAHDLSDAPDTPIHELSDVLARSEHRPGELLRVGSGPGASTQMICGHLELADGMDHPLMASLPALMHVRSADHIEYSWIPAALAFADQEAARRAPGAGAVIQRLSEIIFIQVVRHYLAERAEAAPFLAALADPGLRRAIEHVHSAPAASWTVEKLARAAGMSRTVFAERFRALTGVTPMSYVTSWRMAAAKPLLRDPRRSLPEVAAAVGYEAPEAFQKTFRRVCGLTPGAYRRAPRAEP